MIDLLLETPLEGREQLFLGLFPEVADLDISGRRAFLFDLLVANDLEPFRADIADDLISSIGLKGLLPEAYADFKPIVEDGVRFLLTHIEISRLRRLVVEQALLPADSPAGERMRTLARDLPTLQKLGQIIARNRAIDPDFRRWLQGLETGAPRTSFAMLRPMLLTQLPASSEAPAMVFDPEPMAEASVGVVIGFRLPKPRLGAPVDGVAKLVKPGVADHLQEEIALLDLLAAHFDRNRDSYPLRDFGYARVFDEVKESLRREVDLTHEQRNLEDACRAYLEDPDIEIPRPLSGSTPQMTLMTRIRGESLDRCPGDPRVRDAVARSFFWNLVGKPLFATGEIGLFHGDPHAGNLLLCGAQLPTPRIGILDWSQAIRLDRAQRQAFLHLALGIATCDSTLAATALRHMVRCPYDRHPRREELDSRIRQACAWPMVADGATHSSSKSGDKPGLLARTLDLIDTLAFNGFEFPGEMLWFRKSVFTLLGVLADLDGEFNPDRQVLEWLRELILHDLPRRLAVGFNPLIDRSQVYRSYLSNLDLCGCLHHTLLDGVAEAWRAQRALMQHSWDGASRAVRRFWLPFGDLDR